MGCTLSMLQQLSGINIVMFYSSTIMSSSGLPPNYITALVGFVNCVSVFPTIALFRKFGRKILLWTLSLAIAASLVGLGVCLLVDANAKLDSITLDVGNKTAQAMSVVCLMLFIMFFELSLGPLLWVYLSEVMTEKGLSLGVGVNQIFTVVIAFFTSDLIKLFGNVQSTDNDKMTDIHTELGTSRLFLTCGGITFFCAMFCLFLLKETKGLTDKEVAVLYSRDKNDQVTKESGSYLALDRDMSN